MADESSNAGGGTLPPEQGLQCPRCDSSNTKFCYYNNYSLSQPRHYCKACRRYWTKGGALRNVPVGGGCRKNKRSSRSSSASSTTPPRIYPGGAASVGLDFLASLPFSMPPANSPHGGAPVLGFSHYPMSSAIGVYGDEGGFSSSSSSRVGRGIHAIASGSIASSIESLSSINQDLHWRLQRQRLAMFFNDTMPSSALATPTLGAISSLNDEILELGNCSTAAKTCGGAGTPAWLMEPSNYGVHVPDTARDTTSADDAAMPMTIDNGDGSNAGIWSGSPWPAWSVDMPQFGTLP